MKSLILLTGGSGRLGEEMLRSLLNRGDTVVVSLRSESRKREFLLKHRDSVKAGQLHGIAVDLGKSDAAERLIRQLQKVGLKPTALVHNARDASNLKLEKPNRPTQKQWMREFWIDCGVGSDLAVALASLRGSMLRRVVLISSIYGVVAARDEIYDNPGIDSPMHYSIAKAAVIHLTRELAVRLRKQRVQVNCISYGGVEGRASAAFRDRYGKHAISGRMLEESEISGPLLFLLSSQSKGMTGHNLIVDGGWTAW